MIFKVSGTARYNWRTSVEANSQDEATQKAIQAVADGAVIIEALVDDDEAANITVDEVEGGW